MKNILYLFIVLVTLSFTTNSYSQEKMYGPIQENVDDKISKWTWYYDKEQKQKAIEQYRSIKGTGRYGTTTEWFKNGDIKAINYYDENGFPTGSWKVYSAPNIIRYEYEFEENTREVKITHGANRGKIGLVKDCIIFKEYNKGVLFKEYSYNKDNIYKNTYKVYSGDKIYIIAEFYGGKTALRDNSPEIIEFDKNSILNGIYKEYYPGTEILHFDNNYKEGKEHGLCKEIFDNGQISSEIEYKNGLADGKCNIWYKNGSKKAEGQHENDQMVGKWIHYYENGQKEKEGTYLKDDVMDGLWLFYDKNGRVEEKQFKNGVEISK